jgi:hypothetical protein
MGAFLDHNQCLMKTLVCMIQEKTGEHAVGAKLVFAHLAEQ